MLILGIESSCDDTAAAVIDDSLQVYANIISSQEEVHSPFGGVVPELASRRHVENVFPVVQKALEKSAKSLDQIDLVAATQGPGLIGSLLVGYNFAKSLAFYSGKKFIGVDHMAGHVSAAFLEDEKPQFPFIALIVSGGTSSIFLVRDYTVFEHIGRTRDDAAGEAFDKVAKLLKLPYPGGPQVAALAESGDRSRYSFPRAWLEQGSYDFSFSGLKTAVLTRYNHEEKKDTGVSLTDICASFQEAVIDVLVTKTLDAARQSGVSRVVVGGGVSANKRLRQYFQEQCQKEKIDLFIPRPQFCTDNAAMIAAAGYFSSRNNDHFETSDVYSRSQLG